VAALFMLFFLVLLVFQGAVTKAAGIYDQMQQHKRMAELNTLAAGGPHMNPLQAGPI
jgi:alcohol dehydrogenase YqhD (iron-dependent ADH family)